jgi:hypothetical protein
MKFWRQNGASWAVLAISLAVVAGIGWAWFPDWLFAFATENAPLAWWQAGLLLAASGASALRGQGALTRDEPGAAFWFILAAGLLLAALDERFMFHEQVQDFMFYTLADAAPAARRWVQATSAIYALAGLVLLAYLWKRVGSAPRRWFCAAVLCGLMAITLDIAWDNIRMQMIEEWLETLASTLFLSGLLREAGEGIGGCRGN